MNNPLAEPSDTRLRVVVAMGGGAAPEAVTAVLAALRATDLPLDVLAVSATPIPQPDPHVRVIAPRPDLPDLFAQADLVVSAAGVTLLELCSLAVPAALVVTADNQLPGYTAAVTQGLAAGLGDPTTPQAVATLRHLLTTPAARAARAARAEAAGNTVDGQGARRILNAAAGLILRPAVPADETRILAWRNDPETRRWSVNRDPVAPEEHRRWLPTALDRLRIAEEEGTPIAVVRFDPTGPDEAEVSITLAPAARGRRLARPILEAAHDERPGIRGIARIHRDNTASHRLFTAAGYRPADRPPDGDFDFYTT